MSDQFSLQHLASVLVVGVSGYLDLFLALAYRDTLGDKVIF